MRLGLKVLALMVAAVGASGTPASAVVVGCDAFSASLRSGASDMGVEFSHAIVVSRTRSDATVFDVTTKVDVDATLSCRGDIFLRFEARIGEPANARTTTNFERLQATALKAALGWDPGKSRGVFARHERRRTRLSRRVTPKGRCLHSRQDRGTRAWGRVARDHDDRIRPNLCHRRTCGRIARHWPSSAFITLSVAFRNKRSPRCWSAPSETVSVSWFASPSDEQLEALNALLWTYDEASFLPHGGPGDGDPSSQPIFLTTSAANANDAVLLMLLSGSALNPGRWRV